MHEDTFALAREAANELVQSSWLKRSNLLCLIADRLECNSARLMVASSLDQQAARQASEGVSIVTNQLITANDIRQFASLLRAVAAGKDFLPSLKPKTLLVAVSAGKALDAALAASFCLAAGRAVVLLDKMPTQGGLRFILGVMRSALIDLELSPEVLIEHPGMMDTAGAGDILLLFGLASKNTPKGFGATQTIWQLENARELLNKLSDIKDERKA